MKIEEIGDAELLVRVKELCGRERAATAEVIEHLAEVSARKLHLAQAFSSMHVYCMEVLHLSEHQAYERLAAAKIVRRFPVALEMLREGALHLTGLAMLAPHLRSRRPR